MTAVQEKKTEDWLTSAEDALRVSLISTEVAKGREVDKWNLDAEGVTPEVLDQKTESIAAETHSYESNASDSTEAAMQNVVAIYTPSEEYASVLIEALANFKTNTQFVRYTASNAKHFTGDKLKANSFIVNMTDEDESDLLDQLLEAHEDASTLFLCEQTISDQCIAKAKLFLDENNIV